jgi:AsmA protein
MKKLLIAVGVVIVLLVGIAIIIPSFVPVDSYKIKLSDSIKQSTGRDFAINGKVSLSILPRLAIEVNDVSIGNAPGAASKTMSTLSKVQLRVQLLPLLDGKIVVDSFVLDKPVIDLEIDKNGRPNWEVSGAESPAEPATPSKAKTKTPAAADAKIDFDDIRLGDIHMNDGAVRFTDQRTGQSYAVGGINVTISMPDLDHPLKISGKANYNAKDVTVDLNLAKPRQAFAGQASPFTLGLGGEMITMSVDGEVTYITSPKVSGAVDLKIPSIRNLASWAGKPLALSGPLGKFAVSGKLAVDWPKIGFTDAKIALDAISGSGELSVDSSNPKPVIKGRLALDRLDLNPYLPQTPATSPSAAPASPEAASAGQKGWSTDPINVSGLNAANADLALSFASLIYEKFEIGKGAMTVALHDAHLELDLTQLELYQGSGTGKIVVDGKAVPAVEMGFKLDRVQLSPLVKAAGIGDWISGTLNTDFQMAGSGHSQKELVGTLSGKGDVAIASGSVTGIDIGALLSNPVKAIEERATKTGKTDFASLTGTYTIASGIVKNTDLTMTSPIFQLAGTGTVSLPPQTVDYRIEPKLSAGSKGPGLSVPIKVSGPWNSLSYTPDLASTLANPSSAANAVKGLLGKSSDPNQPKQKPADALKGLFGH